MHLIPQGPPNSNLYGKVRIIWKQFSYIEPGFPNYFLCYSQHILNLAQGSVWFKQDSLTGQVFIQSNHYSNKMNLIIITQSQSKVIR